MPTLASSFTSTVSDGPLIVAALVAAMVGVVGFLSPCVLPLVPGYLSYVAGLSGDALSSRHGQRRMVGGSLLFVLGFSVIFVIQGAVFGELGLAVREHTLGIERVLGAVTIVMGVVFLGGFGFMQREFRVHRLPRAGLIGAPLLGATFGLAWAPCLTPTYSVVYTMSFTQGTLGRGAFLMFCYCLGLGVPFVLVALGFGWISGALAFIRQHRRAVSAIGGGLLIVMGVLLLTGQWNTWMDHLRSSVGPYSGVSI